MKLSRTYACRIWCLNLALVAGALSFVVEAAAPSENLLKAAAIYKVSQFTTWSRGSASKVGGDMNLCIFGGDAVASRLYDFEGSSVGGHLVKIVSEPDDAKLCSIAYLARSEREQWPELLAELHRLGVLTAVNADSSIYDAGSVLVVATNNDKVVFGINMAQARTAGLLISAKVLRLARMVYAG